MPVGRAFDGFVEHTKRVSPTCLVHFETNRYSVPASFANRLVSLRIYPDRLVVVAVECAPAGGQIGRFGLTPLAGLPEDGSHDEASIPQRGVQAASR